MTKRKRHPLPVGRPREHEKGSKAVSVKMKTLLDMQALRQVAGKWGMGRYVRKLIEKDQDFKRTRAALQAQS